MIQRMDETARQLSLEDIRELESVIQRRLPEDYVELLLKYNGGRPTPCTFPIEGLKNNPYGDIHYFFGIDRAVKSSNLDQVFESVQGQLPDNLFPIASDGNGDLICLSLYGDDAGAVLFWDWYAQTPEPSYANVHRIAKSFPEFLDGIREVPDDLSEGASDTV